MRWVVRLYDVPPGLQVADPRPSAPHDSAPVGWSPRSALRNSGAVQNLAYLLISATSADSGRSHASAHSEWTGGPGQTAAASHGGACFRQFGGGPRCRGGRRVMFNAPSALAKSCSLCAVAPIRSLVGCGTAKHDGAQQLAPPWEWGEPQMNSLRGQKSGAVASPPSEQPSSIPRAGLVAGPGTVSRWIGGGRGRGRDWCRGMWGGDVRRRLPTHRRRTVTGFLGSGRHADSTRCRSSVLRPAPRPPPPPPPPPPPRPAKMPHSQRHAARHKAFRGPGMGRGVPDKAFRTRRAVVRPCGCFVLLRRRGLRLRRRSEGFVDHCAVAGVVLQTPLHVAQVCEFARAKSRVWSGASCHGVRRHHHQLGAQTTRGALYRASRLSSVGMRGDQCPAEGPPFRGDGWSAAPTGRPVAAARSPAYLHGVSMGSVGRG
jgi:hypothetical protein